MYDEITIFLQRIGGMEFPDIVRGQLKEVTNERETIGSWREVKERCVSPFQ